MNARVDLRSVPKPTPAAGPVRPRGEELTGGVVFSWTNKDRRLLSHGVDTYEWTSHDDYRVSEVRLLRDTGTSGPVRVDTERAKDNLVIEGDALHVLTALLETPEFAAEYRGKVNLVYIDPPFNTGKAFEHYNDAVEQSIWLTLMRDRLQQIHRLLAPGGTVWLHLSDKESYRGRMLLDEVFGTRNYIGTVVWEKKKKKPSFLHAQLASVTDFIVIYSKAKTKTAPFAVGYSTESKGYPFHNAGNTMGVLTFPAGSITFGCQDGLVPAGDMSTTAIESELLDDVEIVEGTNQDAFRMRGEWRYGQAAVDQMAANGDVIKIAKAPFRPNLVQGAQVKKKIHNLFSFRINDVPTNEDADSELQALGLPAFDTPKPEGLLKRVIEATTEPGDIVLDCFGGSGTTAAVAQKMRRRWITSEISHNTVENVIRPRLDQIVADQAGDDPLRAGYRALAVAASMFEVDESGTVLLAEWVTNGNFAAAVAAQLGYDRLGAEARPFSGTKGHMRLAVVDGVAGEPEVDFLVSQLEPGQRLMLVAKAMTETAEAHLRAVSPGSRLRQAPRDLVRARARSHGRKQR